MIQGNYFTEDPDLVFIFDHVLDWEKIVHACEGKDFIEHKEYLETNNSRLEMAPSSVEEAKDLYKSTLNLLGDFFGNEVTPFTSTFDKKGLKYQDGKVIFPEEMIAVYEKVKDTGLLPYAISRKAGGLGFPMAIAGFYTLIMARADSPLSMAINLLNLAQIIYRYGTYEQIEKFVVPATKGEKLFAMSLTEPDYGSDLNSVRSTATKNGNGNYKINGTKRFISQGCGLGDRPAVLLTLARTGKQGGGARGLSLFITTSDKVEVAGIEHKMGIHASPTCELVYENTDGELLADEGVGLTRCTLGMTNFMRLGTAAGGAGGGAAAYYESLKYASEREQFGKPIKDITAVKEMLAKIRRETNAMRLFTVHTGVAVDMYQHEQIRKEKAGISDREIRQDIEIRKWNQIASVLTPMAKYYCSEEGNRVAYIAVQIHGGAGYTEDYEVARIYRDTRINTIYEGTSQIQVRIGIGGLTSGMEQNGFVRKYIEEKWSEINTHPEILIEQREILETSLKLYKGLSSDTLKEKLAEDVIIIASRFLCSMYFCHATEKAESLSGLEYWKEDCFDFLVDSAGIMNSSLYKIKKYGGV